MVWLARAAIRRIPAMGTFEGPRDCTKVPLLRHLSKQVEAGDGDSVDEIIYRVGSFTSKGDIALIVRNANYTLGRVMRTSL